MIRNVTKKTTLADECRVCANVLTRGIGLMFSRRPTPTVLSFRHETCVSIHTFFVKHYLDVLFLNDQGAVVDLVEGLQPNTFYTPHAKAIAIIEVPEGTIAKSKTMMGDVINFK